MGFWARFIRRSLDKEPMVVVSCLMGAVGVSFAMLGPKLRKRLGYETYQWDGVDKEKVAVEHTKTAQFIREALGQAPQLKRA